MTERKKTAKKKKQNPKTGKSYGTKMNELLLEREKAKHVVMKKRKR